MIEMTPERWEHTLAYVRGLFCIESEHQRGLMQRATAAGLPDIDVGPDSGRLLELLAAMTGARLVVEVGTLAGYSSIWMARGLAPGGRVITIEASPKHAAHARQEIAASDAAGRVEVREGRGGEMVPALLRELGPASVDLVLLDAERSEYAALLPVIAELLRPGGVLVVDNVLAAKRWTPDPYAPGEAPDVMDVFNRTLATHESFRATIVPTGNGLALAVRR